MLMFALMDTNQQCAQKSGSIDSKHVLNPRVQVYPEAFSVKFGTLCRYTGYTIQFRALWGKYARLQELKSMTQVGWQPWAMYAADEETWAVPQGQCASISGVNTDTAWFGHWWFTKALGHSFFRTCWYVLGLSCKTNWSGANWESGQRCFAAASAAQCPGFDVFLIACLVASVWMVPQTYSL